MLMVSVNGGAPVPAGRVVVYNDKTPVAVCAAMGNDVLCADALRDPEFYNILATLGITGAPAVIAGPTIKGNIK